MNDLYAFLMWFAPPLLAFGLGVALGSHMTGRQREVK
jgi:hypothetical protein